MSEWNNIDDSDVEVNFKTNEVEIYAGANDFGSIYAVLTFKQIKEIYERIKDAEKSQP